MISFAYIWISSIFLACIFIILSSLNSFNWIVLIWRHKICENILQLLRFIENNLPIPFCYQLLSFICIFIILCRHFKMLAVLDILITLLGIYITPQVIWRIERQANKRKLSIYTCKPNFANRSLVKQILQFVYCTKRSSAFYLLWKSLQNVKDLKHWMSLVTITSPFSIF